MMGHSATNYTKDWADVRSDIEKGNYRTAKEKGEALFAAAQKEKNSFRILQGAIMLTQTEEGFEEDTFLKALDRYHAIEGKLKGADDAMLNLYVAATYQTFLDNNRWTIRRNPTLAEPSDDMAQWSEQMFEDTIRALQDKVLAAADILQKTPLNAYEELIQKGNDKGQALYPTLYDLAVNSILDRDSSDDDDEEVQLLLEQPAFYGLAADFCALTLPDKPEIPLIRNLSLIQQLTRFHMNDDAAIRQYIDEQRINLIHGNAFCEKALYREGLEHLIEAYKADAAECAKWHYLLASYYNVLTEEDEDFIHCPKHKVKAHDLCIAGAALAPKSEGAIQCGNLMKSIEQEQLTASVPSVIIPGQENTGILSSANLSKVWFRIVRRVSDGEDIDFYRKQPAIKSWDMAITDPKDYENHDTTFTLPSIGPGDYMLLLSSTASFDKTRSLQLVALQASDLTIYLESDRLKGEHIGTVVNRKTGKPVTDCDITLYNEQWIRGEMKKETLGSYRPDKKGFFRIPSTDERRYRLSLVASDGKSKTERSLNDARAYKFEERESIVLFSDRYSYRPGDEVQFSLMTYVEPDLNHFQTLEGKEVTVTLYDVNHKTVATVEGVTDEFGCFSGSFKLGDFMLPGGINIEAHTDNARGWRYLNVEAYKQPTFAIALDEFPDSIALIDTVHVTGSAISYTAVPVQGANVNFVVTRTERPSLYWWRCFNAQTKTVARGKVATAADGTFHFDIDPMFSRDDDKLKDRCYLYNIMVDVTALDGETQSQSTHVLVGKPYEEPNKNERPDVMPDDALLWGYQANRTVEAGETAHLKIGTTKKNVCVVWFLERGYEVVDYGTLMLSDEVHDWTLKTNDNWKGGFTIRFVTFLENDTEERAFSFDVPHHERELGITLTTFRDKLTPGEAEQWTLHVADNGKSPVEANLVAGLYNAALDVYGKNEWHLSPWHSFSMNYKVAEYVYSVQSYGMAPGLRNVSVPFVKCPSLLYYGDYSRNVLKGVIAGYGMPRMMTKAAAPQSMNGMVMEEAVFAAEAPSPNVQMDDQCEFIEMDEEAVTTSESTAAKGMTEGGEAPANVYIRQDLNHTAFFEPCIRTDKNGNAEISFTAPDLLTEWNFQGVAFTKDLRVGQFLESVITRKELMVQPNVPRFLRQGDQFAFTAKVTNISDADMDAVVRLELTDARTNEPLSTFKKAQTKKVHLGKGEVQAVDFTVKVPADVFAVTYLITAEGGSHSDGEKGVIAVLTNRTLVTESLSMFANAGEKKAYTFDALKDNKSKTLVHHKLSLEYTSNPIWYAIQAIPALDEQTNPGNEQLFHRFYANSLSQGIVNNHPQIEDIFRRWAEETPDAFLSNLEKNNDLKQIVLSETPWLVQAETETAERKRIADFFDAERTTATLATLRDQLIKNQNTDGGWSWMPDYESNTWITLLFIRGFGELQQYGCIDLDADSELKNCINKAINYVDNCYYKDYLDWLKWEKENSNFWKKQRIEPICTNYLFARSYWTDVPFSAKTKKSFDFFYAALKRVSHADDGLMTKALTALTFKRYGDEKQAMDIIRLLRESALFSDEMGMYWRDNVSGWYWYDAPVETQSMLIQAFYECEEDETELGLMQQWLLKQKQTTRWNNTVASAHAVNALLVGSGSEALDNEETATLIVGSKTIEPDQQEAGTGYFRKDWEPEDISRSMAEVTIDNTDNPVCSWGALYWQYFEDLDKVNHSQQGFDVKAYYYKVTDDGSLTAIDGPVHIGDKIRVRLRFTVDRALEYVQVKALRPAGLEPVSTRSGRQWNGGLSFYMAVEDAATSLYIDRLGKGDYTVEFDCWASQTGSFLSGTVTLQCLYAPEFRATFSQPNLIIENSVNP